MQQHGALGAGVSAGAAGDGERGVRAVVEEGAFDGDVAGGKQGCPGTFPFGHAGRHGADAVAVVGGDLPCVGGVKDRVVKPSTSPRLFLGGWNFCTVSVIACSTTWMTMGRCEALGELVPARAATGAS